MTTTAASIVICPECGSDNEMLNQDRRSSLVYGCKVCLHEWQMDAGEELVEEVLSVPEPPPTAKSGSRLV